MTKSKSNFRLLAFLTVRARSPSRRSVSVFGPDKDEWIIKRDTRHRNYRISRFSPDSDDILPHDRSMNIISPIKSYLTDYVTPTQGMIYSRARANYKVGGEKHTFFSLPQFFPSRIVAGDNSLAPKLLSVTRVVYLIESIRRRRCISRPTMCAKFHCIVALLNFTEFDAVSAPATKDSQSIS